MKQIIQRRFPIYFSGFFLGAIAIFFLVQVKKSLAPEFGDIPDKRPRVQLAAGGSLRLRLGEEPGKVLAWGFPTRLAVGREEGGGRVESVVAMEYRHLVEPETLIGPLPKEGDYQLIAHFYACSYPGEKYCARVVLEQPIRVVAGGDAPRELLLAVDVRKAAAEAAALGAEREAKK